MNAVIARCIRALLFTIAVAFAAGGGAWGCGADSAPGFSDCRSPSAACPSGFACTEVGEASWACVQVPSSDATDSAIGDSSEDAEDVLDVGGDADASDGADSSELDVALDGSTPDSDADSADALSDGAAGDADILSDSSENPPDSVISDIVDASADADAGADSLSSDVSVDLPLTVSLQLPSSILSGAVVAVATPSGGGPLLGAEFLVDGKSIHTDIIPPYTAYVDTLLLGDGAHTVTVQLADTKGQLAEDSKSVIFDNSPPEFVEIWPSDGDTVFFDDGPLRIEIDVADASGVDSLEVRANGLLVGEFDEPPYELSVPYASFFLGQDQLPKSVFLQVEAVDKLGQESLDSMTVHVHRRYRWTFDTLGEIWGGPALLPNGNVVIANDAGVVYAVSPEGTKVWEKSTAAGIIVPPTVDANSGRIYVGTTEGVVQAYETNGTPAWTKNPGASPIAGQPAVGGDWVVVTTFTGGVFALNRTNGNTAWSATLPNDITGGAAIADNGTVYVGCHNGAMYAVVNGSPQWNAVTGGEIWSTPVIGPDNRVYFGSNDGWVYAVSPNGVSLWERELKGELWGKPLLTSDGFLYIGSNFKRLFKLDTNLAGEIVWETNLNYGYTYSTPVMDAAGTLYLGTTKGASPQSMLLAIDSLTGGLVFKFPLGDTVHGAPLLVDDVLYVGSTDRKLVSLWRSGVSLGPPSSD